jgi:hypothetical protein
MEKIEKLLKEKIEIRDSYEKKIIADIRKGKELVKQDLNVIFHVSGIISTLEELLNN